MVKGIIFKYHAGINDKFLRDTGHLSDPDFESNKNPDSTITPIWSVCGVNKREKLKKGDIIFFMPRKDRYPDHVKPYAFTGVLVCSEKHDRDFVESDQNLTDEYRENYSKDVIKHQKKDRPRTAKIRDKNVIYGESSGDLSRWFGDNPVSAQVALKKVGLTRQLEKISFRSVPYIIDEDKAVELHKYLIKNTKVSVMTKKQGDTREECDSCLD